MAVGSPRYLSSPVSCVMDCRLKMRWRRPKCLRSALSPSAWNTASRRLSQSTFLCRWLHEPVTFVKGQARSRRAFRPWLDHQAPIWVTPHAHSHGLARFHLRVPRLRRNRTPHACPHRQAYRPYSERPVVLLKSPATRTPYGSREPPQRDVSPPHRRGRRCRAVVMAAPSARP